MLHQHVIINNKYVYIVHVAQIKQAGRAFPKEGILPMIITKNGKEQFNLSQDGAFCRVHYGIFDTRAAGDAFIYVDGEWIRLMLETIDFVSE